LRPRFARGGAQLADKASAVSLLPISSASITDAEDRERLILEHLPQVKLIARKVHERIHGHVDLDDLISAGIIGLIAAIDRFDPARGLQLKTYAEHKIRGAILDSLRALDGRTREERRRTKLIAEAGARLGNQLQRTPTQEEVAAEMGLTLPEYSAPLASGGARTPYSLDAEIDSTKGSLTFSDLMRDPAAASPEQVLAESELHGIVSDAIASLPPKDERVITLHYAHGLTMRRIAPLLEMSEWQVQEARRKAIAELRRRLAPCVAIPPADPQNPRRPGDPRRVPRPAIAPEGDHRSWPS
jgi:RNA polymerase sigma factor for flagellar operon FliA